MLGFLSPANRGGLMTAMLLLFVFMGYVHKVIVQLKVKPLNRTCMNLLRTGFLLETYHRDSTNLSMV